MSSSSVSRSYSLQWRFKPLLLAHILIALGLSALFAPLTHDYVQAFDLIIFKALNSSLQWGRPWQVFWALANHKLADWIEDIVILVFAAIYVRGAAKGQKLYRSSQIIFLVLYSALIIFIVNKIILRDWVDILRNSPTLVDESSIKLSKHISWLKIKDGSPKSFPGDHATTAIIFGAAFVYLGSRKMKICAAAYAVFLCLPRMILGAHWLSDVVIGSGSIVGFFFMWAWCTPFAERCTKSIERLLNRFRKTKPIILES